jgi:uncharacterized protein YndB with AHSA1/START domain
MLEAALYVALGLAVIIAAVLVLASRRPDTMKVMRSADIAAPPEAIFPLIDDLRLFSTWSPFEKDPGMKRTYSGPDRGQNQRMEWSGNSEVGEGSVTILDSTPSSRVDMRLSMVRPMRGDNHVTFTLASSAGRTTVTWAIEGRVPLIAKVMALFFDMDRMCGREFEKGLANLKALVERSPAAAASA